MSTARVVIICCANKGNRQHRRKLAESVGGSPLRFEPHPVEWVPQQTDGGPIRVRCPEHEWATITAAELEAKKRIAARSSGRVELRVFPKRQTSPKTGVSPS